jgi:xylulokinase
MKGSVKKTLLGIDIGTSGCKVALFDLGGIPLAASYRSYPLITLEPQAVEEDPLQGWWKSASDAIREVLARAEVSPKTIRGISVSCTNALVCVDADGNPLRPAIMQLDRRSIREAEWIRQVIGQEQVFRITGNPIAPGTFSAPLMLWIKQNEPWIFERTYKFLSPTGFLVHRLTGEFTMDWSRGATTMLFETAGSRSWSSYLCDRMGIPIEKLPPLYPSWQIVGEVSRKASEQTGLAAGTPVVAGAMDTVCAALGCGALNQGDAFYVLGSVGRICLVLQKPSFDIRFINTCHCLPDRWISIACTNGAGLSLRWFKDQLGGRECVQAEKKGQNPFLLLDEEAKKSPPGAKNLVYLPYLAGERSPIWDPFARGVLFGLDARHERSDLIRCLLEGVAFAALDNFLRLEANLQGEIERVTMSGGGARSDIWRKITADVLQKEILVSSIADTETFGNALLAGFGTGIFPDIQKTCQQLCKISARVSPDANNRSLYSRLFHLYRQLYSHLKLDFLSLAEVDGSLERGDMSHLPGKGS